jgi:hypothetical protein
MRAPTLRILLLVPASLLLVARAADEAPARSNVSDAIKARVVEEAKQGKPGAVGPSKTQAAMEAARPENPPADSTSTPAAAATVTPAEAARAQEQTPTVLDPVEVRRRKMTEFEKEIQKQEADIIREKKNTKATELDKALNHSALSKALAIFGGESDEYRAHIASERLSLMEAEKDLIEAKSQAKSKAEKQALQKQIDELRKIRRELEKSRK